MPDGVPVRHWRQHLPGSLSGHVFKNPTTTPSTLCEEEITTGSVSNSLLPPSPPFYTHRTHTFIAGNIFFFLLFCFYYLSIIPLLVLATEKDWANVLRDQTVMTPRAFIWVLIESPISIFPVLRKKNRK